MLGPVWKERINQTLARVTGYELRRAGGAEPPPRSPSATAPAPAKKAQPAPAKRAQPAPAKKAQKKGGRGRKPKGWLPGHYDREAKELIRRVKPRTMTSHEKLFGLILATRYVADYRIPGDVVECGVWRGGSMQAVALTLLDRGERDRDLHLFDTFEGMPPPTEKDRRRFGQGESAAELMAAADKDAKIWAFAPLDDVRQAMDETDYPAEHIHFHQGMVEDTVPAQAPDTISILRLDTDFYESTRHELEHLYDRLSPGGVLIIDDYSGWEGSRQATHEFLDKTGEPLLLLPLKGGRIAVKPWA
jgi:O-methyltransferase